MAQPHVRLRFFIDVFFVGRSVQVTFGIKDVQSTAVLRLSYYARQKYSFIALTKCLARHFF